MKRKALLALTMGCLSLGSCNQQPSGDPSAKTDSVTAQVQTDTTKVPETKKVGLKDVEVAIANENTDEVLIAKDFENAPALKNPERFSYIIYNQKLNKIEYVGIQKGDKEQDNGRDTPYNFPYMSGYRYKVVGGKLSKEDIWSGLIALDEEMAKQMEILPYTKITLPADIRSTLEKRYGRKIINVADCEKSGANGEYLFFAVQFANKGTSALAVVGVVDKNGEMKVKDLPADYCESTWHVDDEGKFYFGLSEVLVIDGNLNLITVDFGGEGSMMRNLEIKGDSLINGDFSVYLYQAPC